MNDVRLLFKLLTAYSVCRLPNRNVFRLKPSGYAISGRREFTESSRNGRVYGDLRYFNRHERFFGFLQIDGSRYVEIPYDDFVPRTERSEIGRFYWGSVFTGFTDEKIGKISEVILYLFFTYVGNKLLPRGV